MPRKSRKPVKRLKTEYNESGKYRTPAFIRLFTLSSLFIFMGGSKLIYIFRKLYLPHKYDTRFSDHPKIL